MYANVYSSGLGEFGASNAWRLAPFFLIALILHVVLIGMMHLPRRVAFASASALEVRLVPAQPPHMDIAPHSASKYSRQNTGATPPLKTTRPASTTQQQSRVDGSREADRSENTTNPLPRFSLESLRDSVRRIVRDEARHLPPPTADYGLADNRPILPELARALARKEASVMQFADGLIKVVTPSGSVFCMRPTPTFAKGGPVEPTSIPTNCP